MFPVVILRLLAHRTYRKAIEALAQSTPMRVMRDHAVNLRVVWETLHSKRRLTARPIKKSTLHANR